MSNTSTLPVAPGPVTPQPQKARYFFVAIAVLFPVIVWLGFFPSYQSLEAGTLEVHWLTHLHGAFMTAWILVFLVQAIVSAKGNLKLHRRLGYSFVWLGVLVFLSMGAVTVHFLIANQPPKGSFLFDLLLTIGYEMTCFGLFFTGGMWLTKHDRASHKRLLTLATFVLLTAAVDRIAWLPPLGMERPYVSFVYLDTLLIPLFVYDLITLRRVHGATWVGTAVIVVLQLAVTLLWGSPRWHQFGYTLTAPLMEKIVEVQLTNAQSDSLLGNYEGTLGPLIISRENDKLYLQFAGQAREPLGVKSETELFLKSESMHFYFVKGPHGQVTKATAKQVGRIFQLVKIK